MTTYPDSICKNCKRTFSRRGLSKHVTTCVETTATDARDMNKPLAAAFHLRIEGDNWATQATYWVHVVARATAMLQDLDNFLRDIWLEPCCGHMSAFKTRDRRFEAYPVDEYGPPAEAMADNQLGKIMKPKTCLSYEYDFGSTTNLRVRTIERVDAIMGEKENFQIVARNEPPAFNCGACSSPATLVCTTGCEGEKALACPECAPDHECGEEMMSSIVNSPRTGTCAYPAEPFPDDRKRWVTA